MRILAFQAFSYRESWECNEAGMLAINHSKKCTAPHTELGTQKVKYFLESNQPETRMPSSLYNLCTTQADNVAHAHTT